MKLYRAGTPMKCSRCDTTIATLRIDRTSNDPVDRDDWIFPGAHKMPGIGVMIGCPKCGRPPKALEGEDVENSNQRSIDTRVEGKPRQGLLGHD